MSACCWLGVRVFRRQDGLQTDRLSLILNIIWSTYKNSIEGHLWFYFIFCHEGFAETFQLKFYLSVDDKSSQKDLTCIHLFMSHFYPWAHSMLQNFSQLLTEVRMRSNMVQIVPFFPYTLLSLKGSILDGSTKMHSGVFQHVCVQQRIPSSILFFFFSSFSIFIQSDKYNFFPWFSFSSVPFYVSTISLHPLILPGN